MPVFLFSAMSSNPRVLSLPLASAHYNLPGFRVAAAQLFEEHCGGLRRYLLSIGVRQPDAEEVVQEVFLLLCTHLRREEEGRHWRGWLFRVAHHLALKHFRRKRTRGEAEPVDEAWVDPRPTPEQEYLHRERDRRMREAVRRLSERDRYCLHLRAEGLPYREIAEVLGISLGGVANSLSQSIAVLSEAVLG